jgi:hypothetical protein
MKWVAIISSVAGPFMADRNLLMVDGEKLWTQMERPEDFQCRSSKLRDFQEKLKTGNGRVKKESGRRYRGDAHVGVLRMLLLR